MSDHPPSLVRPPSLADHDLTASLGGPLAEAAEGPSLQYYWAILRKRHLIIIMFLLGTLLAAGVALFFLPATYTAATTLLIEPQSPHVLDFQQVLAESRGIESYDFYKTQYEILKSRTLAAQVIQAQGLEREPLFTAQGDEPGLLHNAAHTLKGWSTAAQGWARDDAQAAQSELIERYLQLLDVIPTQKTQLVKIAFKTPDPHLSARLANAHAQAYIRQGLKRRSQANEDAQSFLEERLGELKGRVEHSEAALNRYRQAKGIISLDDKENTVVERLADLNKRLTEAEAARIALESQVRLIRQRRYESLPEVVNSAHIQTLTAQALRLEGEYANLAALFKPGYARLDQLRAQVDETRRRLREEIRKVVNGVESSYLAAVAQEKQLRSAMDKQKTAALRLKDVSVGYAILAREVDTNRQLYDSVLQRMKETGVAAELQSSNVVIIDKAAPPRLPSSPKIKQSVFLAVLLGLIGGIGLAFLREHLDDTVKAPEEVQRYLNLPNLGVVPDFLALNWRRGTAKLFPYRPSQIPICLPAVAEPRLLLSYHPLSVVTEAYRTLRTAILLSRAEKPPQTLLFTSAVHGEGKTATAVNTAIVLAQTGVNVLIIDADLRRSRCHEILGADREPGLTEVLTGLHAPQDLIQPTYTDGLFFLGAGSTPPNPPDLVGSKMMHTALASLQEHYDYILIDSPPVVAVSDAVLLSTLVEGVILVVDVQHTPKPLLREARQRLSYARAQLLGTVLNRVDLRTGTYAYY